MNRRNRLCHFHPRYSREYTRFIGLSSFIIHMRYWDQFNWQFCTHNYVLVKISKFYSFMMTKNWLTANCIKFWYTYVAAWLIWDEKIICEMKPWYTIVKTLTLKFLLWIQSLIFVTFLSCCDVCNIVLYRNVLYWNLMVLTNIQHNFSSSMTVCECRLLVI